MSIVESLDAVLSCLFNGATLLKLNSSATCILCTKVSIQCIETVLVQWSPAHALEA